MANLGLQCLLRSESVLWRSQLAEDSIDFCRFLKRSGYEAIEQQPDLAKPSGSSTLSRCSIGSLFNRAEPLEQADSSQGNCVAMRRCDTLRDRAFADATRQESHGPGTNSAFAV